MRGSDGDWIRGRGSRMTGMTLRARIALIALIALATSGWTMAQVGNLDVLAVATCGYVLGIGDDPADACDSTLQRLGSEETGDLSQYDAVQVSNGNLSVTSDYAYGGAYSAQADYFGGPDPGYARRVFDVDWAPGDDVWYGIALYLPDGFYSRQDGAVAIARWDNVPSQGADADMGGIVIGADHRARVQISKVDGSQGSVLIGPFDIPEGRWVHYQVHQIMSSRRLGALTELYKGDDLIGSSLKPNMFGQVIDRVKYGIVSVNAASQGPISLYF